ncbi:MAG TPA: Ig-like domain-containing protein [Gemmatimonadaceae bacterium]|nr:Ig-like domain-containing protein [Gemmatimonadaceae bacterium]
MIARFARTRLIRNAARYVTAVGIAVSVESCKDTTGPVTPETPTGVTAVLLSPTSIKVIWTPASDPSSIRSYNVFRNGIKVGEVNGPLFVDTGLAERVTYRYGVSANGVSGLVSATSDDTPANVIATPDVTPPALVSTSPSNGATAVDRATKVVATFTEALDATTAIAANFSVNAGGTVTPGTVTYLPATNAIEFTPTTAFPSGAAISVSISTGIKDAAGNAMASSATFSFTARDEVPPSVASTTIPASGEVALSQIISVTMSEPIDATSLTATTVRLAAAGSPVAGSISYDAPSRTVTFSPAGGLASATDYILVVGPGIKDVAGNASTTAFVKTFRTVDTSPPTVTSVTPANQSTAVSINTAVNVVFSKDMDASTITTSSMTLSLSSTGAIVAGSVAYDAASRTASYLPSSGLSFSTPYTITVSNTVRGSNGVSLAQNLQSTFTTAAPADATPPTVISVTPSNGSTDVSVSTGIAIKFSEALNSASVTSSTILLSGAGLGNVSGAINYDAGSSTVTFVPVSALLNDVLYTVSLTGGLRDLAGNALVAISTTFRTSAAPPAADVIAPTVLSSVPSTGSTDVAINTPLRINFSEPMKAATINSSTIFLSGPSGTVAGAVSYDNATLSASFVPSAALQNSGTYTLVATMGVTDVAGNSLSSQFAAGFTTIAALPGPDTTPPRVISTLPAGGATNVSVLTPIRVTFSEPMTASSVDATTLTLSVVGIPIGGTVSYDPASRTASFTPSAGLLAENRTYTVTVTTGVRDTSGNPMASNFAYSFLTEDNTPPTVASRNPTPGSSGIAANATISIGFSEAMTASTINSSTLTLSVGGSPVAGSVSFDPNTNVATFTPSSPLANNQTYTVLVTTGARDLSGNALASNDSFTFTTSAAPPAFDISGSTGFLGWWQTTTTGSVGIHFHIVFDQSGSTLTRSPSNCDSGGQDACITLAQNAGGQAAIGPNSPGFAWVLVPSANGVLSGNQISFTMINANGRTFTFNGTVNSPYQMVGTLSGPTLPEQAVVFDRPMP